MADFDFDELDKAVAASVHADDTASNNAVSDASARSIESEHISSPAMHRAGVGSGIDIGGHNNAAEARFEAAPVAATPRRPSALPSHGRFMDIVHPSSDMRSTGGGKSRFRPPVSHNEHESSASPLAQTAPAPVSPESTPSVEPRHTPSIKGDDESRPLESPFLPDAKVEKRPLGGSGAFDVDTAPFLASPSEPHQIPEAATFADTLLEAPDELRLESGEDDDMPERRDDITADSANASTNSDTTVDASTNASDASATTTNTTPVLTGATSISQQYQEQAITPEQQPGAMYDTEAYHQPLASPEKKRSGAWVIFWILLLIIIGAGAGVAAYYFVLPAILS